MRNNIRANQFNDTYSSATLSVFSDRHLWRNRSISSKNLFEMVSETRISARVIHTKYYVHSDGYLPINERLDIRSKGDETVKDKPLI
jgi:hypothetical protein